MQWTTNGVVKTTGQVCLGRERGNLFIHRGRNLEPMKAGDIFQKKPKNGDQFIERARVLSIFSDVVGIPHVRYDIVIEHPTKKRFEDGPRILNIHSFTERFKERVASQRNA